MSVDDDGFIVTTISCRVVSGPDSGLSCSFTSDTVLVGRAPECQIRLEDPTVSRLHFSLCFNRGRWEITDAGSSSGTALNGELLGDIGAIKVVHDGDRISAGRSVIVIEIESERQVSDPALPSSPSGRGDAEPGSLSIDPAASLRLGTPAAIRPVPPPPGRGGIKLSTWVPISIIALAAIFIVALLVSRYA